ncbi:MAG: nuclear transport factor 2 family protein, partial [Rhodothermaceae bacterium]|nr:nuclear transport factor 2 family protein [Rhodothermaceae bacterium]
MKLTKEQEAEIWQVYSTWLTAYLNADVKTYNAYLDDDYHFIGSTNNEEFLNRTDATTFFERTGEQFAGIMDLRNEIKILEVFDTSIFITHFCDVWFINDKERTYYGRFRLSSVMQEKNEGWRFIYQHFSMPDSKSDEGESIGFDKVNAENIELKEAIKRRTIELESKNRELEIETALERVRARAMAMHKSYELTEVVSVLFEKLKDLQIPFTAVGIATGIEDSKDLNAFVCGQNEEGLVITNYRLPYFNNPIPKDLYKALEKQSDFIVGHYSKEEKDAFYEYVIEHTAEFRHLPEDIKRMIFDSPTYTISMVAVKNAVFNINDFDGKILTETEVDIIKRFARVFDQAYTRFLDLQKAESQAKEVQIELSLERIRSQVTTMQESSDLLDIVVTMRTEFVKLGHEAHYFWHMRWLPEHYKKAMTSGDGSRIGMVMTLPRHIHGDIAPVATWEKSGEPTYILAMDVDTAVDYVHKMITLGDFEQVDPQAPSLDDIRHIGGLTFIMARTTHGEIGYSLPGVVPDPPKDAVDTLVRFAGVFDLAYKRFEDLKAAEHQHREAQIELALERVRARTMAMQHSDELADASRVLDEQVRALGIETWGCAFHIYADNADGDYEWFSSANGNLPFYKTPREKFFLSFYEKGQRGETFHIEEFAGEDCKAHYDFLKTLPVAGDALKALEESGIPLPDYQIDHIAFFSHGYILFITYKPVPEAHEIFRRFARVFEQTYTRFIALQKLEAQALRAENDLIAIKAARHKAEEALTELKATQEQLVQQEKLASLGQLTAGIA